MANATLKRAHNISAMLWANRLYEGGWFDEVVLFQDACRNRIGCRSRRTSAKDAWALSSR